MNAIAFNATLDEFCTRLLEAFPGSSEICRAREIMSSMMQVDVELPAKTFAIKMQPFARYIEQRDASFMDGPDSPLHFLGIYSSWTRMHGVTRQAVMDYVSRMAILSGVQQPSQTPTCVDVSTPPSQLEQMAGMVDPALIANILDIARSATSSMTDADAKALLEGRNAQKLGDLCFSIIDSLNAAR